MAARQSRQTCPSHTLGTLLASPGEGGGGGEKGINLETTTAAITTTTTTPSCAALTDPGSKVQGGRSTSTSCQRHGAGRQQYAPVGPFPQRVPLHHHSVHKHYQVHLQAGASRVHLRPEERHRHHFQRLQGTCICGAAGAAGLGILSGLVWLCSVIDVPVVNTCHRLSGRKCGCLVLLLSSSVFPMWMSCSVFFVPKAGTVGVTVQVRFVHV